MRHSKPDYTNTIPSPWTYKFEDKYGGLLFAIQEELKSEYEVKHLHRLEKEIDLVITQRKETLYESDKPNTDQKYTLHQLRQAWGKGFVDGKDGVENGFSNNKSKKGEL